jgi:AraC-like DNA-binding protein
MRTDFKNYNAIDLLETVESDLGVNLNTSCQRTEFPLPSKIGNGAITTYLFKDGLALFLFNGTLRQDWEWVFNCEEDSPVFIFFSLSGIIERAKKDSIEKFILNPLDTLVAVHLGGIRRSMIFKKKELISLAVLRLDHKKYFENKACSSEDLPEKMQVLLSFSGEEIKCLLKPNRTTPEAVQLIREMMDCPYKGLVRTCLVEAKARQFLAIIMQRMEDESTKSNECEHMETVDYQKIQQAKELLTIDLTSPPTIMELSRKVGINRQKLKQDFKLVFEKTIYQYLVSERMNAAKEIMMKQPVPVLLVAKMVGYENASHFAKRFRERFGLLPSEFLSMVWRSGQEN